MLKQCPRGENDGSCRVLYVRMGNYFEVLEISESIGEIHVLRAAVSFLSRNQMPWYKTSEVSCFYYLDIITAI